MADVTVIGGGLAGSEAAWQAAEAGCFVELWEMRPVKQTPAHYTEHFAELVCSNSLGKHVSDHGVRALEGRVAAARFRHLTLRR